MNVIPPMGMLGAALVLGLVVGFSVALIREMIRPRVGNAREAERLTGAPVLARIDAREELSAELNRRRADRVHPVAQCRPVPRRSAVRTRRST